MLFRREGLIPETRTRQVLQLFVAPQAMDRPILAIGLGAQASNTSHEVELKQWPLGAGIDWAADAGMHLVNLSLGTSREAHQEPGK
jgi:hypothetical protein